MKIIEVAKKYVGQFELAGNAGFKNAEFQKQMIADGWKKGEAWCCYFQEMIWEEAYPEHEKELDRLFSANCMQTLRNFESAGYEISSIPVVGSLMIMQRYTNNMPTQQGHAGLITALTDNSSWLGIEGNTNSSGSREGDSVQEKPRSLMYYASGLRVAGFVLIREKLGINDGILA